MPTFGNLQTHSQNDIEFLNRISSMINFYLRTYENILTIGDFNLSIDNSHLEALMQGYDLSSLIKKPTCFQFNTPSCVDLILKVTSATKR